MKALLPHTLKQFFLGLSLIIVAGVSQAATTPVLNTSGVIHGFGSKDFGFSITMPGIYKVSLTDALAPQSFAYLGLGVFNNLNNLVMGPIVGTGSTASGTFSAGAAGNYKASVFGITPGSFNGSSNPLQSFGSYSVMITPVPEIQTWAMILVGAGMLSYHLRRRSNSSSQLKPVVA